MFCCCWQAVPFSMLGALFWISNRGEIPFPFQRPYCRAQQTINCYVGPSSLQFALFLQYFVNLLSYYWNNMYKTTRWFALFVLHVYCSSSIVILISEWCATNPAWYFFFAVRINGDAMPFRELSRPISLCFFWEVNTSHLDNCLCTTPAQTVNVCWTYKPLLWWGLWMDG